MMRYGVAHSLLVVLVGLLAGGCDSEKASNPAGADRTYGIVVEATDAIPVPAVAAEADRYADQRVTVDGRVVDVAQDGCALHLDAETSPPLLVRAARTDDGACAWQVPSDADGFAVATGTLRVAADTLRLTANGVRVTPVRVLSPDS